MWIARQLSTFERTGVWPVKDRFEPISDESEDALPELIHHAGKALILDEQDRAAHQHLRDVYLIEQAAHVQVAYHPPVRHPS